MFYTSFSPFWDICAFKIKKSIWKNSIGFFPPGPRHVYLDCFSFPLCSLGHGLCHYSNSGHSCCKPLTQMQDIQWLGSSLFNNSHALDHGHESWFTSAAVSPPPQGPFPALEPPLASVTPTFFHVLSAAPFQSAWSPHTWVSICWPRVLSSAVFLPFLCSPPYFWSCNNMI